MATERCPNFNHTRSNVPVRFCSTCGVIVNNAFKKTCDAQKHASRRKDRNVFCSDCGKKLN